MQFPLLVHTGQAILDVRPWSRLNGITRRYLQHHDRMAVDGQPVGFQKLEPPATPHAASTHRTTAGR